MKSRLAKLCVVAALTLGGWGGALASVLCAEARAASHESHAETQTEGGRHCHGGGTAQHSARQTGGTKLAQGSGPARGLPCTHCLAGREGAAPAAAAGEQSRRAGQQQEACAAARTAHLPHTTSHLRRAAPAQESPPGPAPPRHLLLGVFLI